MPLKTPRTRGDAGDVSGPGFERIRRILKTFTGFHLHSYKDACIKRRLAARMRSVGCATADDYADLLMRDKAEPAALIKTLTIHVSTFFRNPTTFGKLRDEVLPSLFSHCLAEGRDTLQIWSVGCASGEEPYTLALVLRDSFAREMSRVAVSITASDIDSEVLRIAGRAIYEPERLEGTPPALRERFFRLRDGKYHLMPEIREMVDFHHDDLLRQAPRPECDLILCRNVLIYFERSHQVAILNGFADSLRPGGVLVLGKTETLLTRTREAFRTVCPVERIYRKL
jgi:chemotaxis protein methyltransferase CheR